MSSGPQHYLKAELDELVKDNSVVFDFLQHGSLDGIWYWDLENPEHEWMSPEMWQLLGEDPATKEHSPKEWQDIIFQDDLAVAMENFKAHCADPGHPYDQIVRYRHKNNSVVWVRCRGIAIRDQEGRPIRMLGAHNDITEFKEAEEAARQSAAKVETVNARLSELIAELARSNRELDEFAYTASHDLKEPLRGIAINAEFLAREELSIGAQRRLDRIVSLAERMEKLISDLLFLSRLGRDSNDMRCLDVDQIVHDTCDELSEWLSSRGGEVDIVSELPRVHANKTHVAAVFKNLIINGIKYNKSRRKCVNIGFDKMTSLKDEELQNVFWIRDNGIGIADRYKDQVFQVFQRLNPSSEYGDGSGAGLSVVKKIIEQLGGKCTFESVLGEGTTFYFQLPVQARK